MLRFTSAAFAPAIVRSGASTPFARALLAGRLSETCIDSFFFDVAQNGDADAAFSFTVNRNARAAELTSTYLSGSATTGSIPREARPLADVAAHATDAVATAKEVSAAMKLMLGALVEHSKVTTEFKKILADTESMQRLLSITASSVYALDSAAMATEAAPLETSAADSALLAVFARQVLSRCVGDAVAVMNPSCVFASDAEPDMPSRFKAVQHVANGTRALVNTTDPLLADATHAAVTEARGAVVAPPEPSAFSFIQGKGVFNERRAGADFPVNMYLTLPAIELCDNICDTRSYFAKQGKKPIGALSVGQATTLILAEYYASVCTLFRASAMMDKDAVAGYSDVIKAQVFLESSRHARGESMTLVKFGNSALRCKDAATSTTPPTELPAPKQSTPDPAKKTAKGAEEAKKEE